MRASFQRSKDPAQQPDPVGCRHLVSMWLQATGHWALGGGGRNRWVIIGICVKKSFLNSFFFWNSRSLQYETPGTGARVPKAPQKVHQLSSRGDRNTAVWTWQYSAAHVGIGNCGTSFDGDRDLCAGQCVIWALNEFWKLSLH